MCICMHLLVVTSMCSLMVMQYVHVLFFKSKLRQVYLTKMLCTQLTVLSEVTISARGYNPLATVYGVLQLAREDRNDDFFASCLQV